MTTQHTIFKGLQVIDLSTVLAGPSVGTFFAELGADVLKVENKNHPDSTRSWKLPKEEKSSNISAYFSSINYQKKYTYLDLNKKEEREKCMALVKTADIVLMNYKLGDQEKLKITDAALRKENPQLIIGKVSGFGTKSDRVAYDLILQAESGFMSMNGTLESGPVKMPIALIDVLAAHHLKEGILMELLQKSRIKEYKGNTITVSLYEAAISSLVNQASNYLMNNFIPQPMGSLHPNIAPYGEIFNTKDKRKVTFAIGTNKHFEKLCYYLDLPHLLQKNRFSDAQNRVVNRKELFFILQKKIEEKSADSILKTMHSQFVPCGEIKDLEAVFKNKLAKNLIRTENIGGIITQRVSSIGFKIAPKEKE